MPFIYFWSKYSRPAGRAILIGGWAINCLSAFAQAPSVLDTKTARVLVTPFYKALTASSADAIAPLLQEATSDGWMNCSTNEMCQTKAQTIQRWSRRIAVVPDMRWTEKQLLASGSQIVVRGEASGTPVLPFLGITPQGRSFRVMTIDIHDVQDGKIVHTYHLEDWMDAVRQLSESSSTKFGAS